MWNENRETPRLVYDPDSGITALEFRRHNGKNPNCLDRRIIVGVYKSDLQDQNTQKIIATDVCVLSTLEGPIPTAHDYDLMRELLYPMQKDGVF